MNILSNLEKEVLRMIWLGQLRVSRRGQIHITNFDNPRDVVNRQSPAPTPPASDATGCGAVVDFVGVPELAAFCTVPASLVRRMIATEKLRPDGAYKSARGVGYFFRRERLQSIMEKISKATQ